MDSRVSMQYDMNQTVFISDTYASYYYQYGSYYGSSDIKLGFYPQAGYHVHGGGTDTIDSYVVEGIYSPKTLQMGLEKSY
jgi:hypothetical protein